MPKAPRKHHFVQAEHIRQFVNANDIVWVYGKDGSQFHETPEGIFKKRDLNSFKALSGLDTSFENYVTKIENECWPSVRRIIDSQLIDDGDLIRIATYLSLSRMRNPTVQAGILEQHQNILDTSARLMDARGQFNAVGANPIDPNKSLADLLTNGSVKFAVSNVKYLKAVEKMVLPFARLLTNGFRWCLVRSPGHRVIISDHPLTYVHPGKNPGAYGIAPGGESCEMAFPLSRELYLLGLWENGIESFESEDAVDELNKRQAIFANRHIASCHNKKWLSSLAMRYSRFGFQTVNDRIGPTNGSYHITRVGVYQLPGTRLFKGAHPLLRTRSIRRIQRGTK